jgi:hypothetical protein
MGRETNSCPYRESKICYEELGICHYWKCDVVLTDGRDEEHEKII